MKEYLGQFLIAFMVIIFSNLFNLKKSLANNTRCVPEQTAVVNLSLTFKESKTQNHLPGVSIDRKVMRDLFQRFPNQSNLTDSDVRTKQDIIDVIKARIKKAKESGAQKPDLFFNYAGHGLITSTGEFAIPLPSAPKSCFEKEELQFVGEKGARHYRATYAKSFVNGKRGLSRVDISECEEPSRGLGRPSCKKDQFTMEVSVFDDTAQNCRDYFFTGSDLEQFSDQANIFGIVDSCHSGALARTKGVNVIASAGPNEIADDDPFKGGKLFQVVQQLRNKYFCSVSRDNDNDGLSLAELIQNLPQVIVSKPDSMNTKGKRGLIRDGWIWSSVYFGKQNPQVSEFLKQNSISADCYAFAPFSNDGISCVNPMKYSHVATSEIKCGPKSRIRSGDTVVIVNEFEEGRRLRAFTNSCGVFEITGEDVKKVRRLKISEGLGATDSRASDPATQKTGQ